VRLYFHRMITTTAMNAVYITCRLSIMLF